MAQHTRIRWQILALLLGIVIYVARNKMVRQTPTIAVKRAASIGACTQQGVVSLIFSNGITLSNTPKIINALKANNIQATFLVSPVGLQDDGVATVIQTMINNGNTVGLFSNATLGNPSTSTAMSILNSQLNIINSRFKTKVRYVTFPYGTASADFLNSVSAAQLQNVVASVDLVDFNNCNSETAAATSVANGLSSNFTFYNQLSTQSSFIFQMSDLCAMSSAVTNFSTLVSQFKYRVVDLATCYGLSGGNYLGSSPAVVTTSLSVGTSIATSTLSNGNVVTTTVLTTTTSTSTVNPQQGTTNDGNRQMPGILSTICFALFVFAFGAIAPM